MSNKVYDILKWFAQLFLPATATLYFAVSQIWGLPFGEEIVGTITAVDAFLGIILGVSTSNYNRAIEAETRAYARLGRSEALAGPEPINSAKTKRGDDG